jgi:hypothetical protein
VRLNERWIWVGETSSPKDAGVTIYVDFPGQWWLARGKELAGPFDDSHILRALRVACTPVIDGCEKSLGKSGFLELARRPLKPRPRQSERAAEDLPPSISSYDKAGLDPVSGCCTRFDSPPPVVWGPIDGWDSFLDEPPAYAGILTTTWNAHPPGSRVYCNDKKTFSGLTIVDLPNSREPSFDRS